MQPRDSMVLWFMTIALKDAYFDVEIFPQHRTFLRFTFGGDAYQYWVPQFSLALSPCTCTKCMDHDVGTAVFCTC